MLTDGAVATMFDARSASSVVFVSGSEQFTRTFIDETFWNEHLDVRVLLTDALLQRLRQDRLVASKLQQLCEDDRATVRTFEPSTPVETVVVADGELRIGMPTVAKSTEHPYATVTDPTRVDALTNAYGAEFEAASPPELPFARVGWMDFLDATADRFDESFRVDLEAATAGASSMSTQYKPVTLAGLLCLVAAAHECEQRSVSKLAHREELASEATISQAAGSLDDAGIIQRENTETDRPGRPPKRLSLVDDTIDPAEFAAYLRTPDA